MTITATTEYLPVLVYGTLRKDQGNYNSLIAPVPHALVQGVRLQGHRMHGGWGFPYITPDSSFEVVCDLVVFPEGIFTEALRRLDSLEGYRGEGPEAHNHYDRKIVTVDYQGTAVRAYVYVASPLSAKTYMSGLPVVEHGDWVRHISERAVDDEPRGETMTRRSTTGRWSAFGPIED